MQHYDLSNLSRTPMVPLTEGTTSIQLNAGSFIYVVPNGTGSDVLYTSGQTLRKKTVTQNPAAILLLASNMISVTSTATGPGVPTGVILLSEARCDDVLDIGSGTSAEIVYKAVGDPVIPVSETRTVVLGLLATAITDLGEASATTITAFAGGGQGSAVLLAARYNEITTVATDGDSIKLPLATATLQVFTVKNAGANDLDVFPNTSDTINGGAADAAISMAPGESLEFWSTGAVDWITTQTVTSSATTGITAFATGGQGSAVLLTTQFNDVTTVATIGDSVKLPLASGIADNIIVKNSGATALDLFPNTSDTINGGAADAAIRVAPGTKVDLWSVSATNWETSENVTSGATTGITAFATGGQGSAVLLITEFNDVTTVATAGDSVKLPAASTIANRLVVKNSGVNSLDLFPNTGDAINGGAANAAIPLAPGVVVSVYSIDATNWESSTGEPKTVGISITEAGAAASYTGTVTIPAGAFIHDIGFVTTVLWDGTSASLDIGDIDDPNGWFAAVDLKATDLLVGEVLSITNSENWGASQGVYLVAATGRKGRVTAGIDSGVFQGAATEVQFLVTPGAADGTAGRSFGWVTYSVPVLVPSVNV